MSLLNGYAYHIFISYRQNDNRSGWVTAFVQQLQQELAATLKEPVTIYFDNNPHDGILETHVVDKTLQEKLKCLIFIPILSQTYCDSKSFAWQNEFCAFNKLSKEDSAGRDVRLRNGNVASRILPVKIHDLDPEDIRMVEGELGGPLRAIDFIFKSPGVNRPLLINEDHPTQNANKAFYRDQINKVANGIKDIVQAPGDTGNNKQAAPLLVKSIKRARPAAAIIIAVVAIILTLGVIFTFTGLWSKKVTSNEDQTKTVAVLAFSDLSPGHDNEWFSDGLTDEILNRLTNLRKLRVTARTSSFYFKGKNAPIQEIGEKLGVDHVVEGSVQRVGNKLRITAQLIRAQDGFHLWSQSYDRSGDDLFEVQSDIALNIAQSLLKELSDDTQAILVSSSSSNEKAHDAYLMGIHFHDQYMNSYLDADFKKAENQFLLAISADPKYGDAYGELANLYDSYGHRNGGRKWQQRDSIVEVGDKLSPGSISNLCVKAMVQMQVPVTGRDSAFQLIKKAYTVNPNHITVNRLAAQFYFDIGLNEFVERFYRALITLDPMTPTIHNRYALIQMYQGQMADAYQSIQKSFALDPQNAMVHSVLFDYYAFQKDTEHMIKELEFMERLEVHDDAKETSRILLKAIRDYDTSGAIEDAEEMGYVRSRWTRYMLHFLIGSSPEQMVVAFDSLLINNDFPAIELEGNPIFVPVRSSPEFRKKVELRKKLEEEFRSKYSQLE